MRVVVGDERSEWSVSWEGENIANTLNFHAGAGDAAIEIDSMSFSELSKFSR